MCRKRSVKYCWRTKDYIYNQLNRYRVCIYAVDVPKAFANACAIADTFADLPTHTSLHSLMYFRNHFKNRCTYVSAAKFIDYHNSQQADLDIAVQPSSLQSL
jgi:hypothetical protein